MLGHHLNPHAERTTESGEEEMVSLLGAGNWASELNNGDAPAENGVSSSSRPATDQSTLHYGSEGEEEDHLGTIDWSYERVQSRVYSSTLYSSIRGWPMPLRCVVDRDDDDGKTSCRCHMVLQNCDGRRVLPFA
jgi:hypothetical protein